MSKKQDDAHKVAGLASILQSSNKGKEVTVPVNLPPSPAPPLEAVRTEEPAARTRKNKAPVGKSSDPSFKFVGFYLRKETQKAAKRRLEDLETGQDLSDLVEELLQQWLMANS